MYSCRKLRASFQMCIRDRIYSGYTYEEIFTLGKEAIELLCLCDTLVDGRFVLSLRSL